MSSLDHNDNAPEYWRSLDELANDPAVIEQLHQKYPDNYEELADPLSRRNFVQLMGASLALAGVAGAGCKRWEKDEIVPLSRRPEDYIPGVPQHFGSAMELGGHALGVLVTAYEGRPIKIEGNPDHPFLGGGSSTFAQASVLGVYDPDRSKEVLHKGQVAKWEDFDAVMGKHFSGLRTSGSSLRVLSEASSSPTMQALRAKLIAKFPGVAFHEYEPLSMDNEREGLKAAYGESLRAIAELAKAKVIVSFDGDPLVDHPAAIKYAGDFAKGRRPDDGVMNRLYAVEAAFSHTGSIADHRLPLRSELVLPVLMAIDAELGGGTKPGSAVLEEPKVAKFLAAMVSDLKANRGQAVLLAGPRQPAAVHALIAKINNNLGAVGSTLRYVRDGSAERPHHRDSIASLVADMSAGKVGTLVIVGGNPVFDAPADLDFATALAKVEHSIHLSLHVDETSAACEWHLPRAHYLEAWGDARAWDGTVSVTQPIIEPLYRGRSPIEVVALMLGEQSTAADAHLRAAHDALGASTASWRQSLHDGFVANTSFEPYAAGAVTGAVPALTPSQQAGSRLANGQLEVVFTASTHTYDGRFANNSWLQETPDFVSKITWDNAALISPATAGDLGLATGDVVRLDVNGRSLDVAVYEMPGTAPYALALAVGGGRTKGGRVQRGVGFDTYKLRTTAALTFANGATVKKTGGSYKIVTTQDHWDMRGRGLSLDENIGLKGVRQRVDQLVRQQSFEKYQTPAGKAAIHEVVSHPPLVSLFADKEYDGYKWGMATDLSTCTGCNACAVACQAENNVPVVGKDQVSRSREMSWIRLDRYFKGDPADPQIVHQPMACQHCENAPCEQVCPVGATLHSQEGLNDMAYNRCVGTRYCANNCPYRVRRFNFLEWNKDLSEARNKVRHLVFNPEVTVRERGVMEKCTFCVQRIQNTKISAKNERRRVRDGEIQTACQAACPTSSIVFGDLNDKDSAVAKLHATERSYELLGELNNKPRNRYLARIRNPHPDLG